MLVDNARSTGWRCKTENGRQKQHRCWILELHTLQDLAASKSDRRDRGRIGSLVTVSLTQHELWSVQRGPAK